LAAGGDQRPRESAQAQTNHAREEIFDYARQLASPRFQVDIDRTVERAIGVFKP
jgi:hypothetical protein